MGKQGPISAILCSVSALALVTCWSSARAQDATPPAPTDRTVIKIPEVVITAEKREEKEHDVPLSVSAITATEIQDRGASRIDDLQYSIPGLSLQQYGPGEQRVQLRGISAAAGQPTVGVYLDEIPTNTDATQTGINIRLIDLDRVEVLRGPQGTLYGEGSMGGTIKYITANPDLHKVVASFDGDVGGVAHGSVDGRADAVVSTPIVDGVLGMRLAVGYENYGGFINNTTTGKSGINNGYDETFRLKTLYSHEDTSVSLLFLHQKSSLENQDFGFTDRTSAYALDVPASDRVDLLNLVAKHDFGFASLLSTTGYIDRKTRSDFDVSSFFVPVLPLFGLPPGYITGIRLDGVSSYKVWTQELRLTSDDNGPLNWSLGGYYRDSQPHLVSGTLTVPNPAPFTFVASDYRQHYQSMAVFGEASYKILPVLQALVGLRYFYDDRQENDQLTNFGAVSNNVDRGHFHSLNPRFNVKYDVTPDTMAYINIAKGFRSGGFNAQSAGFGIFPIPPTFAPEKLWTYEVGTKNTLFDHRLSLETAVYYNDWSNIQSSEFAPGSAIIVTGNGGAASGPGVDFQATLNVLPGLNVSAAVGYSHMRYDATTPDHTKDDPIDFVSDLTSGFSAQYNFNFTDNLPLMARADFMHTDGYQETIRNFNTLARSQPQNYLNLRTGVELDKWQAYIFVNNLLDQSKYIQPPNVGVLSTGVLSAPRIVGLNLRAQF